MEKEMDRRNFIKGATFTGAAVTLAGLGAVPAFGTDSPTSGSSTTGSASEDMPWDGEYDLVVVGAGGAGLGAALRANESGASVLLIEYQSNTKQSNTALCGGVVMACATSIQEQDGYTGDSAENFKKYIAAVSGDLAYIDLLNQWAERSTDTFNWLVDQGVNFPADLLYFSGQEQSYGDAADPYPRGHIADGHIGASITNVLTDNATAAGVEFLFDTRVTELLKDADGRVVGVTTENGKNFKGDKGVVLTSGGFSRNKDMLKNFIPEMLNGGSFGSTMQQGDGTEIALKAGAKIGNMWAVQAKCVGTYLTDDSCPCNTIFSWGNPCVHITEDGVRGWAEDTFYEKQYELIASQPHSCIYIVWDQSVTDLGAEVISVPPMSEGLESEVAAGEIFKADTYEELADQMGVPADAFAETMDHYNEMAAAGVDEDFGRVTGLAPVNTPPYYACKSIPAICDTAGGIVVDTKYEVLDNYDEPIPGLYAAGATTAGWRGLFYVGSGTAVCYALTTGRIAAESALGL